MKIYTMPHSLHLILLLATASLVQPAHADDAPATIFMAADGSDLNPGTQEKPLATLEASRDAIRKQRQQRPGLAAKISIADGTYPLGRTVEFTPEDSGVTYEAAPNAKPIFSGGSRITGWKKLGEHLWQAIVPEVGGEKWRFEQLWVNGVRATRARTPNQGWFYMLRSLDTGMDPITGGEVDLRRSAIGGYQNDLAPLAQVPAGELGDVAAVVYHAWEISRHRGRFFDKSNSILHVTRGVTPGANPGNWGFFEMGDNMRYHLENFREALDAPGEWFLGRDGVLIYYPRPGEDMSRAEVIAPRLDVFINLMGDAIRGEFVEDIAFRGLSFQHGQYILPPEGHGDGQAAQGVPAVFMADGARQITVENCEFAHIGTYGIWFREGCSSNTIRHCYLNDLGAGGVRLGRSGWDADPAFGFPSHHNLVDNNIIRNGGRIHYGAVGVLIGHTSDNQVTHNDIADFFYSGISVGFRWRYDTPSLAKRNLVEANHVHHLGWGVLSDMGGIYTLGLSEGTVIRGNHIHHISSYDRYGRGGLGLYNDGASSGILMENNLVHDVRTGCYILHYGHDNILRNNIFAFSSGAQLLNAKVEPHLSLRFEHNIVIWKDGPVFEGPWREGIKQIASNLYWRVDGQPFDFSGLTFPEWQKTGHDTGSLVADPMFVDASKRDFRLREGSPAFKIGFRPFDLTLAGVYGEPAWVALAARDQYSDFVICPEVPAHPPFETVEDFEKLALGTTPPRAVATGGAAIGVSDQSARSGKHSLKFSSVSGTSPQLGYTLNYEGGEATCSFDLRLGPGAEFTHEWRDNAQPYRIGPSFSVSGGVLRVADKTLPLPADQWVHFEIKAALGAQSTGTWDMTVQVPGVPAHPFTALPCAPGWKSLAWIGWGSTSASAAECYLDNLTFRNDRGRK